MGTLSVLSKVFDFRSLTSDWCINLKFDVAIVLCALMIVMNFTLILTFACLFTKNRV